MRACSGYDLLLSFLSFYKLLAYRSDELLDRHFILPFPGSLKRVTKP